MASGVVFILTRRRRRVRKYPTPMDHVNSITQRVYCTPLEQKQHLPISSYEVALFKDAAAAAAASSASEIEIRIPRKLSPEKKKKNG